MNAHAWLDVIGWVVTLAASLVATVLGVRLSSHDEKEKRLNETLDSIKEGLADNRERLARLEGFIGRNFKL